MNLVTERYFDFHCPSKPQQLACELFDNLLGLIAYACFNICYFTSMSAKFHSCHLSVSIYCLLNIFSTLRKTKFNLISSCYTRSSAVMLPR
uniref:Uncharacterized protein n=1 Tax=Setaria italica TaxID=4555 RepID=K3ZFR0_SETIT